MRSHKIRGSGDENASAVTLKNIRDHEYVNQSLLSVFYGHYILSLCEDDSNVFKLTPLTTVSKLKNLTTLLSSSDFP